MDAAFETYARLIPVMQELLRRAAIRAVAADSEGVHRAAIRAKALDTLRGMLPAATQSNVGIYGTGQAYEALLLRMRAHPARRSARVRRRRCSPSSARSFRPFSRGWISPSAAAAGRNT